MNNGQHDVCAMQAKGQASKRILRFLSRYRMVDSNESVMNVQPGFQTAGENPAAVHQ